MVLSCLSLSHRLLLLSSARTSGTYPSGDVNTMANRICLASTALLNRFMAPLRTKRPPPEVLTVAARETTSENSLRHTRPHARWHTARTTRNVTIPSCGELACAVHKVQCDWIACKWYPDGPEQSNLFFRYIPRGKVILTRDCYTWAAKPCQRTRERSAISWLVSFSLLPVELPK